MTQDDFPAQNDQFLGQRWWKHFSWTTGFRTKVGPSSSVWHAWPWMGISLNHRNVDTFSKDNVWKEKLASWWGLKKDLFFCGLRKVLACRPCFICMKFLQSVRMASVYTVNVIIKIFILSKAWECFQLGFSFTVKHVLFNFGKRWTQF